MSDGVVVKVPTRWPVWVVFLRTTTTGLDLRGPIACRESEELLEYCAIAAEAGSDRAIVFRAEVDLGKLGAWVAEGKQFRHHPAFLLGYVLREPL